MQHKLKTLKDLEAYKAAGAFRVFISRRIPPSLPEAKKVGPLNRLKRARRSIAANFRPNAPGPLCETLDHVHVAKDDLIVDRPSTNMRGKNLKTPSNISTVSLSFSAKAPTNPRPPLSRAASPIS